MSRDAAPSSVALSGVQAAFDFVDVGTRKWDNEIEVLHKFNVVLTHDTRFRLARRNHHSPSQVETIASFQEVVRLAIVLLAIGDGDASTRSADDFKSIPVHDESCTCIHSDAQQARIRGHDPGEVAFPVRALVDVDVDRGVWKEAESHAILVRDQIPKIFALNPATDQERAQNHCSCGATADHAALFVK